MASRSLIALAIAIVLVGGIASYTYYDQYTRLDAQSDQISSLQNQVNSLQAGASTLQSQLAQLQQSESSSGSQITSLQGTVQTLQGTVQTLQNQLTTVQVELQSQVNLNNANYQTLTQQIQNISSTLRGLAAKLGTLFPQVPQSALTITGSNYDNTSAVYTFMVHNTQNYTIYAQLSASFYGPACNFYAGEGSYMSQVLAFGPGANLTVPIEFKGVAFTPSSFCGKEPISYFSLDFVASATVLSQSYSFQVNPPYSF